MTQTLRGLAVMLLSLGLALPLAGCAGGDDAPAGSGADASAARDEHATDSSDAEPEREEGSIAPLEQQAVQIFYPAAGSNTLVGEYHQIFDTATPEDRAKQIVADLIAGPNESNALPALPREVRLRQVFVLEDGTAYLDFSGELSEGLRGGSMEELLAVYSIVNSVAINVREVSRVAILINGRSVETLSGHLDLRRPLPPDRKLISASS